MMCNSRIVMLLVAVLVLAAPVQAARIRDVARFKGDLPNEIVGFGLIVGLKGTGDGGKCLPAVRPLKQMLGRFDNPVALEKELENANNIAVVTVSVMLPTRGVHEGDKLDVRVSSVMGAKSLKGGRLFWCPLVNPAEPEPSREEKQRGVSRTVFALASGNLIIDDETNPTQAIIKDGAVMTESWHPRNIVDGRVTLAIRPAMASLELASSIADQINQDLRPQTEGRAIAQAVDATTVVVTVPQAEIGQPTEFLARITSLPLPAMPGPAKVLISTKTRTIIFTDEVELSPTMVTHGGLTITVGNTAVPAGSNAITLDPQKGAAKLKDLEAAFNLLRVNADDRIAIVRMLYNAGALKCELQVE